jgi:hypothetical protein
VAISWLSWRLTRSRDLHLRCQLENSAACQFTVPLLRVRVREWGGRRFEPFVTAGGLDVDVPPTKRVLEDLASDLGGEA